MNPRLIWIVRTGVTVVGLVSLIETGRRNGWI
jgi:hypothetical protein